MESVVHIVWLVYKLILYRTGANTHICYTQALLHILVLVIALCSAVVSTQLCALGDMCRLKRDEMIDNR